MVASSTQLHRRPRRHAGDGLVEPGGFGTGIWEEGQRRLPEDLDDRYAKATARAHSLTGRSASLFPDPVWVARVVRLALGSPRPLARYLVGVDAVGLVLGQKLAPTVVADYGKGLSAGLRSLLFRR